MCFTKSHTVLETIRSTQTKKLKKTKKWMMTLKKKKKKRRFRSISSLTVVSDNNSWRHGSASQA
ncbi:WSSV003 [White spot syndrome virus]|uniref:WSSV003 n=1 Tax=White spot syndrome virus TaxID=342409 RepID=A0A2I6SBD8_9VIRU|nr:WSSV003 [White spot syndrome virus]